MVKRITSFLLAMVLFAGLVLTGAPTVQAAGMTSSDALVEMIKAFEGFVAYPCWDYASILWAMAPAVLTICWKPI